MAWTIPWNLLGAQVAGDLADYTVYSDRFNRKIPFPKSPPKEPPSPLQQAQRSAFASAQAAWSGLSTDEKAALEAAVKISSIPLTGQNLYISCTMRGDADSYATIARQSGIPLPPLP
jgi:hypothetical protein